MTTTTTPTSGAADLPEALRRSTAADGKTELFNLPGYPLMVRAVDFNRIHAESEMRRTALLDEMQKAALAAAQAVVQDGVAALVRAAQAFVLEPDSHKKKLELEAMAWGPLAAGQATAAQPAAQQGVAYAALPDIDEDNGLIWQAIFDWKDCERGAPALAAADRLSRLLADQMRAFAGATCELRASHGQAPAGWNLVPTEPTQAMLDAVVTSMDDFLLGKEAEKQYREDWAAMLAAAPAQQAAQPGAAYAALPDGCEMLKHALWLASSFTVHRYLMSNAEGRWSGAEKAACHDELCCLYVAVFRGVEVDQVRVDLEADWMAVHDATQELTDHMDVVIGFPLKGVPDYDALAPKFFAYFHRLATHALRASHGQAPAQAASSAVLKAIREANMQLVRTGDDAFMLVPYKAVTAQAADSVTAPAPPPECETEAEKRAFAFGWFKALESERMKAESVQEDAARYRFLRDGEWRDTDLEPFIRLQLNTLWDAKIDAARKQGEKQ